MNYQKIYESLIHKRKINVLSFYDKLPGTVERHHIIPKCINGSNDKSNIINVTPREHYILHLLLERIYRNTKYDESMKQAVLKMRCNNPYQKRTFRFNSHLFEKIRINTAELASKRMSKKYEVNGQEHTIKEWSKILGIPQQTIRRRIKLKQKLSDVFSKGYQTNKLYEYNGQYHTKKEWAKIKGLSFGGFSARWKKYNGNLKLIMELPIINPHQKKLN